MWWWLLVGFSAYAIVKTVLLIGWRQRIVWWELFPGVAITLVCAVVSSYAEFAARTYDTQYRAGWITTASYYEDWNEAHMEPVYDSEGNLKGYRQVVDYHPEYWEARDNFGRLFSISQNQFKQLTQKWGNKKFVDMHRAYHTNDGDRYDTNFPGSDELLVPHTGMESYTNRTQAAPSLFNFEKVDDSSPVYRYPHGGPMRCPSILGEASAEEHRAFTLLNCRLSPTKDVHVWVLIWKNQPLGIALDQESYWTGGNRNEIVVCIGVNNEREVQWSYVFGWTKAETMKANIKNKVMEYKKLDLIDFATYLRPEIVQSFTARNMEDFDYITIEPSNLALWISFILTLLAQAGLGIWLVQNEHREGGYRFRVRWRR